MLGSSVPVECARSRSSTAATTSRARIVAETGCTCSYHSLWGSQLVANPLAPWRERQARARNRHPQPRSSWHLQIRSMAAEIRRMRHALREGTCGSGCSGRGREQLQGDDRTGRRAERATGLILRWRASALARGIGARRQGIVRRRERGAWLGCSDALADRCRVRDHRRLRGGPVSCRRTLRVLPVVSGHGGGAVVGRARDRDLLEGFVPHLLPARLPATIPARAMRGRHLRPRVGPVEGSYRSRRSPSAYAPA